MRTTWLTLAAAMGLAGRAMGAGDGYNPPSYENPISWTAWICAVIFLAAIAVVGFKNSRRTHLD